jgi:hypothetical protein
LIGGYYLSLIRQPTAPVDGSILAKILLKIYASRRLNQPDFKFAKFAQNDRGAKVISAEAGQLLTLACQEARPRVTFIDDEIIA